MLFNLLTFLETFWKQLCSGLSFSSLWHVLPNDKILACVFWFQLRGLNFFFKFFVCLFLVGVALGFFCLVVFCCFGMVFLVLFCWFIGVFFFLFWSQKLLCQLKQHSGSTIFTSLKLFNLIFFFNLFSLVVYKLWWCWHTTNLFCAD